MRTDTRSRARAAKIRIGVRRAKAAGKQVGINGQRLARQHKAEAIARTAELLGIVREFYASGLSYRQMVVALNARGAPTPSLEGRWHVRTLQRLVSRAGAAEALLQARRLVAITSAAAQAADEAHVQVVTHAGLVMETSGLVATIRGTFREFDALRRVAAERVAAERVAAAGGLVITRVPHGDTFAPWSSIVKETRATLAATRALCRSLDLAMARGGGLMGRDDKTPLT
jgi:hypothetical protein